MPVFADHEEVRCNRVNARIVNHKTTQVVTLEMSCPWVSNREKKNEEKTVKYAPLRWELKQQFPDYEVKQHNIIIDALRGWSREMDTTMYEIVGNRSKEVLKRMQKVVLSGTLNIARTFKVVTLAILSNEFLDSATFSFLSVSLRLALLLLVLATI